MTVPRRLHSWCMQPALNAKSHQVVRSNSCVVPIQAHLHAVQVPGMMKPVQPSTPASPTPRARSAPFSVHSRGVMLFDQHRLLDGKFIGLGIFRCCPACAPCRQDRQRSKPTLPSPAGESTVWQMDVPAHHYWRAQPARSFGGCAGACGICQGVPSSC